MSNGENAYANESVNFTTICAQTLVQNLLNYYGMFNSNCILIFFLPGSIRWWSILNPISQAACHPQYRWHWCWRVWSVKYDKVKICRVQKFTSCLFIIFKKTYFSGAQEFKGSVAIAQKVRSFENPASFLLQFWTWEDF